MHSFDYVIELNGAFGTFINGSWNRLVGMLVRAVSKNVIRRLNLAHLCRPIGFFVQNKNEIFQRKFI